MEQLSNCLELSVNKYDQIKMILNNQHEESLNLKKITQNVLTNTNMTHWTEIGFYVFSGFLLGCVSEH